MPFAPRGEDAGDVDDIGFMSKSISLAGALDDAMVDIDAADDVSTEEEAGEVEETMPPVGVPDGAEAALDPAGVKVLEEDAGEGLSGEVEVPGDETWVVDFPVGSPSCEDCAGSITLCIYLGHVALAASNTASLLYAWGFLTCMRSMWTSVGSGIDTLTPALVTNVVESFDVEAFRKPEAVGRVVLEAVGGVVSEAVGAECSELGTACANCWNDSDSMAFLSDSFSRISVADVSMLDVD